MWGCALQLATPKRRSVRPLAHRFRPGRARFEGESRRYTAGVKAFRRVMLVLGVAAIIGGLAKFRGKTSVPRSQGGWRELEGPNFR